MADLDNLLPEGWMPLSQAEAVRIFAEAQRVFDSCPRKTCPVRGCRVSIPLGQACCEQHWRQIPPWSREELENLYDGKKGRPYRPPEETQSQVYLALLLAELAKLEEVTPGQ
jgi:hypothetical protein